MARKSAKNAIEPKAGQLPGYSEDGMTPRGAFCVMTIRVTETDDPERTADKLWGRMAGGLEVHRYLCGPRIVGDDVVYAVRTIYRGPEEEGAFLKELQSVVRTGTVTMSHAPEPALLPVVPGIDAPAVTPAV